MADWKKQEDRSIWLPTKDGEQVVGVVWDVIEGMYGNQHVIETADGTTITTPSHKVLQNRLVKATKGQEVKIVYVGEEPPSVKGQNPTKMYEVYLKE